MPLKGADVVLYEKRGEIVQITLNRPERLNALTVEVLDRLDESWCHFRDDPEARVAILTGTGRAFCSGMDLKDQAERVAQDPSFDLAKLRPGILDGTVGTPTGHRVNKPVIAAINGVAAGGGFLLSLYCDLRLAVPEATLGIAEVKVGRGSPWATPLLFQLPLAISLELIMRGDLIPAQRLYEHGYINSIVPAADLLPTVENWARTIAQNAPLSIAAAKEAFQACVESNLHIAQKLVNHIYHEVYSSQDAIEGVRAFTEKRKPVWKGK